MRPGTALILAATVFLAPFSAACDDASDDIAASAVRDSAGIRIIESRAPAEPDGWSVAPEPALRIGTVAGAEEYALHRVSGMRRLADGRIVIASDGGVPLRFYSPAGEFLHASGRAGDGPGEFRTLLPLLPFGGDSLLAYDYMARRISVLDDAGRFGRAMSLAIPGNYWPDGAIGDSLILVTSPGESGRPSRVPGVSWDSTSFFLYRGPDAPIDTIARYPLAERFGSSDGLAPRYPFAARARWAASSDGYFLGWGERWEIGEYDAGGRLRRLIRRAHEPVPATPSLIEEYRAAHLEFVALRSIEAASPEGLERFRQRLDEAEYRSHLPAYSRIRLDDAGNLWVEDYRYTGQAESRWSVFGPHGRWLATVDMPPGLEVHQIGEDFVLGLWLDESGVEFARLHALRKPRHTAAAGHDR